ncbi:MAG: hypothetical protein AABW83_03395 [Nanoarchaeota archaeon]
MIIYTSHLKKRLKLRNIPYQYPNIIFENSDERFFDVLENKYIAVKKLKYNGKLRDMLIAYESRNGYVEIITIHPIREDQIANRMISGRWLKI